MQATDITGEGRHEVATSGYARSPRDVLRLVAFALTALVITLLTRFAKDGVVGFEDDLVELFAVLSPGVARVVSGAMQIFVALIGFLLLAIPIARRRWRILGYLLVGNAIASSAMFGIEQWLERPNEAVLNEVARRAGIASDVFPDAEGLAAIAAAFVVLGPFVSRTWRRAGAASLVVVVLTNLLLSAQLPAHLFVALPLGGMVGAGVLVAFGRPHRRPTVDAITAALTESALPVVDVRAAEVDARGSTPYFATTSEGPGVFAKVLGEDERAADLLFRLYRFLRMKNVGDDRPFSSLRRTVEHEALLSLYARDVGVHTPRMRTVLDVGDESMLLAYDMIDGKSLDAVDPDALTDELMTDIWRQVAVLRQRRIAHRDLRLANVFAGADGEPSIIDFGFSELAAPDSLLDADVAQLLASFTVVAGPARAVATAIDVLGPEPVGSALPRLQPMALSGATQAALKAKKGLLGELQAEVVARTDVGDVEYEQLSRVTPKTIFTIVMLAAVTYFLVPQFADLPGIVEQVQDANWAWFPAVVAVSVATYVCASISLKGAVPDWLPYGPTFATQIGSSFASKLAPAGLGGMALNVRFLQKSGVDHAVAISSVGLNSAAGFVGHIIMLGLFVVWAGRDAFGSVDLPDPTYFLYGIAAVAVIAAIAMAIPVVRQQVVSRIFPIIGRSLSGIGAVVRRPLKLVQLIGGSALVTLSYLVCVYFSVEAFGGGLSLATVGAVYLAGSAVATAAPTPGGLGAVEAALIGGFVAAGLDNSVAVPAVFMFRLATFWLPILPGWLSFTWLQRNDYV